MNWTTHPYLYQLTHWWHWLSYGQNASVLQAVAAVVATAAAIVAGYFAARAYRATVLQVDLAREQLRLARSQFEAEREHLEEERRANKMAADANYKRTVAEEEAVRPRFRLSGGYRPSGGVQNMEFTNIGSGPASDVRFVSLINSASLGQKDYVAAGGKFVATFDPAELVSPGVEIRFKTTFGSVWQVIVHIGGGEPEEKVKNVNRLYTPTDGIPS